MKTHRTVRLRWMHSLGCVLLLAVLLPSGCSRDVLPQSNLTGSVPVARVLLLQNQSSVVITAQAAPTVRLVANHTARRVDVPAGVPVVLSLSPAGWMLGTAPLGSGELLLTPSEEGSVSINKLPYRGRYRFVPLGPGIFDVVNDVDIEGYLKGVISREMLPKWKQIEAFKAQAVVARTYAIWQIRNSRSGSKFDLYDDERSQVYGGITAETAISREAVDATTGVVVAAGAPGSEKIFKAYFSSCCGGIGQSAADAFGDPPSRQLEAQDVGNLCAASPRFNWGPIVLSKSELTARLQKFARNHDRPEKFMSLVSRVEVASRNVFGRPVKFAVTDEAGRRFVYTGEEFRTAANTDCTPANRLTSSFFEPTVQPDAVIFIGRGNGHGVGMCQYCTEARAELGEGYEQIVTESYPQSRVFRVY